MPSGELSARISQMRSAAQALRQGTEQLRLGLEAVDSEVRALGAERFMSLGAEAFRAEYARLTPRLRETLDVLAAFQARLSASADDIELAARASQTLRE
jgi:uncharacterized protein YukE